MPLLLIISPHLDDAVLSCGARIAMETARGTTVLVVTCFTEPGDDASPVMSELYRRRRTDDYEALTQLGATPKHLGLTDAPFRDPRYHNFSTILFHHRLPTDEALLVERLGESLKTLAKQWSPDEILLPLGVGGHIDHHLVWEGGKSLWDGPHPVSFYEELPYALIPGWAAVRCRELGGTALGGDGEASAKIDLVQCPYPFVRNYLSSAEDILESTRKYDKEFAAQRHGEPNAREWLFDNTSLIHNLLEFDEQVLDTKCAGITRYTTEWPVLFGGAAERIPDMLRQFGNAGRYAEISWRLKTTQ